MNTLNISPDQDNQDILKDKNDRIAIQIYKDFMYLNKKIKIGEKHYVSKEDILTLSKGNRGIIIAYMKGYRVSDNGKKIISPFSGEDLAVKKSGKHKRGDYFTIRFERDLYNVTMARFAAYQYWGNEIFHTDKIVTHKNYDSTDHTSANLILADKPMVSKETRVRIATIASRQANPRKDQERLLIYEQLYNNVPYNKISKEFSVAKGTLSYMKNGSQEYKDFCKNR